MPPILIVGWQPGMAKVSVTTLLQREFNMPLDQAKRLTDAIIRGEPVKLDLPTRGQADTVAAELPALGAVVEVVAGAGAG